MGEQAIKWVGKAQMGWLGSDYANDLSLLDKNFSEMENSWS